MAVEMPFKSASFDRSQSNSVFISYASEDFEAANRLYGDLKDAGFDPWLDKENILPGKNWDNEIHDTIKSCRYIIILFSSHLVKKSYIHKELKDAILEQQYFPPSFVYIIPARLDNCEIPYQELEKIQKVDLFPNWTEGFGKIQKSLNIPKTAIEENKEEGVGKLHQKIAYSVAKLESTISREKVIMPFGGEKQFFVGRTEYINKVIKELLTPGCCISIIGPGGSGKSQLAFKAMHQYYEKDKIVDIVIPVYFADVGLMSIEQFLFKIAEGLNVNLQEFEKLDTDGRKQAIYISLNQRKHPLLYLDNYEIVSYVLNDQSKEPLQDAVDISYFLNNGLSINTSVLLTSREMNNKFSKKEQRIELEGLNDKEAKELFVRNVDDSDRDILRNTDNPRIRKAIYNVIEMTGGHPLSIEVISKNISSVDEIDEMTYALNIKKVNRDEPNKRLQSLYASLEYTVEKLDVSLKQLLADLMLFKSPFPIPAAMDLLGAKRGDIINLYNRSLLTRITTDEIYGQIKNPDYWLYNFYPSTRNYLQSKINDLVNLEKRYGEKFCQYYYELIENTYDSIGKEDHRSALARYNILTQNPGNDFERSITILQSSNRNDKEMLKKSGYILIYLGLLSRLMGYYLKAIEYHNRSLKLFDSIDNKDGLTTAYSSIGQVYLDIGDYPKALEYHNKALEIHEGLNDRVGMAGDYADIGLVYYSMGDYPQALKYYIKPLVIDEWLNDRVRLVKIYRNIGLIYQNTGHYTQALEYHNKALEIDEGLNDRVGMTGDYANIGLVYNSMGDYTQALESHNKALEIDEWLNDRVGMAIDYSNIGIVYYSMGDYTQALEYHNKALEIHEGLNDRVGMGKDYTNIGLVYYSMGHYPKVLEYHNKAREIDESLNDRVSMAIDYSNIGQVYNSMGDYPKALEYHSKALKIDESLNRRVGMAEGYKSIGLVYYDMGDYPKALEYHNKARKIDESLNDRVSMAIDYSNIGQVYNSMGDYPKALEYHNKALEIHGGLNDRVGRGKDYRCIGIVYYNTGDYSKALEYHNKAREIDESLNRRVGMARDYRNIGLVYYDMGDHPKALEYHNKAREIDESLNRRVGMARDYRYIGIVYNGMGDYSKALEYHNKAREIDESLNRRVGMARDYRNIGLVYYNTGDYSKALEYHNKAREIDESLNRRVGMARDYRNIGIVYNGMGDYPKALEYHNKAREIDESLNDRVSMAIDYSNIGLVYNSMGDYPQALEYHNKAHKIRVNLNDRVGIARNHYNMSFPLYETNEKSKALDDLTIGQSILTEFREETGYSHPLLKDIEERIDFIKQEQSD